MIGDASPEQLIVSRSVRLRWASLQNGFIPCSSKDNYFDAISIFFASTVRDGAGRFCCDLCAPTCAFYRFGASPGRLNLYSREADFRGKHVRH